MMFKAMLLVIMTGTNTSSVHSVPMQDLTMCQHQSNLMLEGLPAEIVSSSPRTKVVVYNSRSTMVIKCLETSK